MLIVGIAGGISRVVLVEGILILTDPGLRNMLDIKVYVDADIIIPRGGEKPGWNRGIDFNNRKASFKK